jgi:hypothetical protein
MFTLAPFHESNQHAGDHARGLLLVVHVEQRDGAARSERAVRVAVRFHERRRQVLAVDGDLPHSTPPDSKT